MSKELEALKEAVGLIDQEYSVSCHHIMNKKEHDEKIKIIKNFILKSQHQARELKEFKEKNKYLLLKIQNIYGFKAMYDRNLDFSIIFDKLKKLVGGNDERRK